MRRRHEIRMKEKEEEEEQFLEEDLDKELASLKKKGNNKYKEITEAGIGLKKKVYELMKIIWDKEEIPSSWNLTTLVQIYKKESHIPLCAYQRLDAKSS